VLIRKGGRLHALADRCSHRGCPLHDGTLNDDETLTCPCHGSTFRLDGALVKGPATSPQPAFDVRANEGAVEIRALQADV
jgi:nitrite reductase/ring-hydroxylating ferredoxin subunit